MLFGAHYDHIGYQQTPPGQGRGGFGGGGSAPGGCTGSSATRRSPGDIINNGADDDGSGTVAVMAIAKAFATGPKPKRSLLFVWHAGEEAGPLRLALHGRLSRRCRSTRCRRSSTST